MTVDTVQKLYEDAGQAHLFYHLNRLSPEEREEFMSNLASVADNVSIESLFTKYQEALDQLNHSKTHPGDIRPLPAKSYESIIGKDDLRKKYASIGLKAIKNNEVAVILMAGGQGTRLGSTKPKGCYDIGLPSHKSLFRIQAEKLLTLQKLAGSGPIHWYIMTSKPTRQDTEAFFAKYNYFGLNREQIHFFNQGILPALDLEGKNLLLESPTSLVEAPNGNGGLYLAMRKNNILGDMKSRGIKHVYAYCVDNVLSKIADPVFVGYAIAHDFELATKVVRKRDAHEPVGLIASKDNKPCVIEYSEISTELAEARDENDPTLLKLRAANIVNHYYSVKLLERELDNWCEHLIWHLAKKKISYYDNVNDEFRKPAGNPTGIKLEHFIFDVFPLIPLDRFGCLEVDRNEEFSPLKNGPGSKTDNPETSRQSYLKLGTEWLKRAGALVDDSVLVEVSNTLSYGGENLEQFKGVKFDQDGEVLD